MKRFSSCIKSCFVFEEILKCKWTLLVLNQIARGLRQPGALERSIPGISRKVLYQRLKKLERYQVITRRLVSEKPLKVYYTMTPLGRKINRIVNLVMSLDRK